MAAKTGKLFFTGSLEAKLNSSSEKNHVLGLSLLNNRYPSLHGLRVVAIFFIVQVHMSSTAVFRKYPIGETLKWYSQAFWPGMDFFFVLSGFLIGSILFHSLLSQKKLSIGRFYLRRAFRIFPLYYVCLLLISALPQASRGTELFSGLKLQHSGIRWQELVYLTNYPFDLDYVMYWSWSLSVEEHFYLVVPFLILGISKLRGDLSKIGFLCTLWLSCQLSKAFTVWYYWDHLSVEFFNRIYFPTHTRYDCLVAGIVAAYCHLRYSEKLKKLFEKSWASSVVLLLNIALFALVLKNFSIPEMANHPKSFYLWGACLVGTPTSLCFAALILWAVYRGSPLLASPLFHRISTLGYAIYLIHIPVLEVLVFPSIVEPLLRAGFNFSTAWVIGLATAGPILIFFSYVLHLLVEKPMLALREKWCS